MVDELLFIAAGAAVLLAAGLLVGLADRKHFRLAWLLAAALLFAINEVAVTRGLWLLPRTPGLDGNWNWSGKLLALAVTLAIAALPIFGWRRIGLTFRQEQLRGALVTTGVLLCLYAALAWVMGDGGGDAETLAFQLTMPGLEEEIFYRGVFLLALDRAFTSRIRVGGAPIGWSLLLCSLMFGLIHGLGVRNSVWSFDLMAFALPFIGAIPAVWLRAKTGSVVLPIVMHNLVNTLFVVLPL